MDVEVIDEAGEKPLAQFLAEAQAAKDAALLASLQERDADLVKEAEPAEQEPFTVTTDRPPMNRADRRRQVKAYAAILALTERQEPVVNKTIIPRRERRRRKQHRA